MLSVCGLVTLHFLQGHPLFDTEVSIRSSLKLTDHFINVPEGSPFEFRYG